MMSQSTNFIEKLQKKSELVIAVLFLCVIISAQLAYDRVAPHFQVRTKEARKDLLPAALLPYIHFGFSSILADIYWIRMIQDHVTWDGKRAFFIDYFKNITTLDPRFEQSYLFAIWAIPSDRNDIARLDEVAGITNKGIESIPTSWRIPYYLGTQYYLFTKTYDKAKEYLKIATEKKDAPPGVYLNYSSFVINEVKGYRASYDLVKVIYDTTSDETLKKIVAAGLEKEVINTMLERGILAYKTTMGVYPSELEQLTVRNFVSLPSTFLEQFTVFFDKKTGGFRIVERR